jgi:hypothetical protein
MPQQIRKGLIGKTPRKVPITPTTPVERKPHIPTGDAEDINKASNLPVYKGNCFVDYDHTKLADYEMELFETDVQLPNSPVKARVKVCLYHKAQMESLKKDELSAIRAMSIAPYGKCHICELPVGIREENTPLPDKPGDTVPVTFWEHLDDPIIVCHERCVCKAEVKSNEDPDIKKRTGGRVGRHRRISLV